MNNSMCHNGAKITEKLGKKQIGRAPRSAYSQDLSPCDFRLFGMLKEKMRDRAFRSGKQILAAMTKS